MGYAHVRLETRALTQRKEVYVGGENDHDDDDESYGSWDELEFNQLGTHLNDADPDTDAGRSNRDGTARDPVARNSDDALDGRHRLPRELKKGGLIRRKT